MFEALSEMESGRMMENVVPVGGEEKAKMVNSIIEATEFGFERAIYVGDSITDVEALRLVGREGGLSVSFNGNRYAVESAEVAVISERAEAMKPLVSSFLIDGRAGALTSVERLDNVDYPRILVVKTETLDSIARESSKMRRSLRGEKIGTLG
jgi:energy-converting hydrogenase A subunit R